MQLGAPSIYSGDILEKYTSPVRPKQNAPDEWTAKLRRDLVELGIKGRDFYPLFNASLRRRVVVHSPAPGATVDVHRELSTIFEEARWFDDETPEQTGDGPGAGSGAGDADRDGDEALPPPPPPPPPPVVLHGRIETYSTCPQIVTKYVADKHAEGSGGLQVSPKFIRDRTHARLAYADAVLRNPRIAEVDFTPMMPSRFEQTPASNPRSVASFASPKFRELFCPPNLCNTVGTIDLVNYSDHPVDDLWDKYCFELSKIPLKEHWKIAREDRKRKDQNHIYSKHAFVDALRAARAPEPRFGPVTDASEVSVFFSVGTDQTHFLSAGDVCLRTLCSSSAVLANPEKWRIKNAPPGILGVKQRATQLGCPHDDPVYPIAKQLHSVPGAFRAVSCVVSDFGVAPVAFYDNSPVEYIMVGRDGTIRGRVTVPRIGVVGTAFGKPGLFASPDVERMAGDPKLPSFGVSLHDKNALARTVVARRGGIDPALVEAESAAAQQVVAGATVLPLVLRGGSNFGGFDFSATLPKKPRTKRRNSEMEDNMTCLMSNIGGPMFDPAVRVADRMRPHLRKRGRHGRNSTKKTKGVIVDDLEHARDFFANLGSRRCTTIKEDPADLVRKAEEILLNFRKTGKLIPNRWEATRIVKSMEIEIDPNSNRDQQNSGPQLLREQAVAGHAARATLAEAHALGHTGVRVPPADLDGRFGFTYARALTPTAFNKKLDAAVTICAGGTVVVSSADLPSQSTERLAIGFAAFLLEQAKKASVRSEILVASSSAPQAHLDATDLEDTKSATQSIEKLVNLLKTALPRPLYQKLSRRFALFDPSP